MHLRSHLLINNCDRLRTLRQLEAVWDLSSAASHFSESVSPPRFKRSDGNLMFEGYRYLGLREIPLTEVQKKIPARKIEIMIRVRERERERERGAYGTTFRISCTICTVCVCVCVCVCVFTVSSSAFFPAGSKVVYAVSAGGGSPHIFHLTTSSL